MAETGVLLSAVKKTWTRVNMWLLFYAFSKETLNVVDVLVLLTADNIMKQT